MNWDTDPMMVYQLIVAREVINMPEDLGAQVRSELFKRKMSQKDLAAMVGISGAYLTDIIRGRKDGPKAQEHIKHIRKILNI